MFLIFAGVLVAGTFALTISSSIWNKKLKGQQALFVPGAQRFLAYFGRMRRFTNGVKIAC
ncbi:hypothetical protein CU103_20675 [Phyllobacterium sophorae]|uniref:Uncharacterized protein n=1 Tax=Phyllobacterium sophorae TaxID=1520277 RepID=A0A2P7B5M1_9HYPH|nr:hypothetical protein CU103_20675 [Phyllobacterium sophorae]